VDEHISSKISRLELSMNRIANQFEAIRNGETEDAALRVTTDQSDTDIALAGIQIYPEEYFKYTCGDLADKLNIQIHDVLKMIKSHGLRGNCDYHKEISSGKNRFIRKWSDKTYSKLKEAVDSGAYSPKLKKLHTAK